MKRYLLALLIILILVPSAWALNWQVQVEGLPLEFDLEPVTIEGQFYVPLYKFYQALGLSISYDDSKMTVTGEKKGLKIETKIGSNVSKINGNPKAMPGASFIMNNRTMVPLRYVAEVFGYQLLISENLHVIYLRPFLLPYKDLIEANETEALINKPEGLPPVTMELKILQGKKEHYLDYGAAFKEEIIVTEKKDPPLDEKIYEASRFYINKNLYANFVLVNTSDYDIDQPFNLHFMVKGKLSQKVEIASLKRGASLEIKNLEVKGLTEGNNILEVYLDPEGALNKKASQDYFYRIIYAYKAP